MACASCAYRDLLLREPENGFSYLSFLGPPSRLSQLERLHLISADTLSNILIKTTAVISLLLWGRCHGYPSSRKAAPNHS